MNDLGLILSYLYPGKEAYWELRLIDGAVTISRWDDATLGTQPTQAQLDAAKLPAHQGRVKREVLTSYMSERGALFPEAQGIDVAESDSANMEVLSNALTPRAGAVRDLYARWGRAQRAVNSAKTLADLEAIDWARVQAVDEVGVAANAVKAQSPSKRDEAQDRQIKGLRQELATEKNKNLSQAAQITDLYRMMGIVAEAVEGRVRSV